MKIAAVSMVKDECDIIELFIRINARAVDHLFVLDNGSSDSTCQILELLIAEGIPITLSSDTAVGYPQDKITTDLIRHVASLRTYDWIFPLDADEFIQADRGELRSALAAVPAGHCGLMNWATFVPAVENMQTIESAVGSNFLWSQFCQRAAEVRQYGKVIIPAVLAHQGSVAMGNHHFRLNKKKSAPSHLLDIPLAHVPIRSSEQLVSKAIIGSHKFSIKENRRRGEGVHWDAIATKARENGYMLSHTELKNIALSYALGPDDTVNEELLLGSRLGVQSVRMQYPELAHIDVFARFDAFMGALCAEVRSQQERAKKRFIFF